MREFSVKIYDVRQKKINVRFSPNVASIDCTGFVSSEDLTEIYIGCKNLIQKIKTDYRDFYQKDLQIDNASFMAEIWGHLVAYRIALWMKKNIKISLMQRFADFVAFRSGVIDCGETKVDTNRWFWDIIGWMFFGR